MCVQFKQQQFSSQKYLVITKFSAQEIAAKTLSWEIPTFSGFLFSINRENESDNVSLRVQKSITFNEEISFKDCLLDQKYMGLCFSNEKKTT